ncbi:Shedu immune nuclease family protein [Corynebacterium sp. J010B-136]|uniref:Shedu immune nuclease family protein n=1 Tax=Corynebacterium sp. J010B-136 TaxID=2099401 RepID=UPI000CF8C282|nr:Shedu immune nuclease family protein [Corynebacterium sp. J010B-136]PQM75804.1 DUF4263 domain-containing protein [Corynebacterium sp. J010B-136]
MTSDFESLVNQKNDVYFAQARHPDRTYISRSFPMTFGSDKGEPARFIRKVFDEVSIQVEQDWEWKDEVIFMTPGGRKQIRLNVARSRGTVRSIRIERVPTGPDQTKLEKILELDREQSRNLIDMIKAIDSIPIEGDQSVRLDDAIFADIFSNPAELERLYTKNPQKFKSLIQTDSSARDVAALQHRKEVVGIMESWLTNETVFEAAKEKAGGPEAAWQKLLEDNPWILGIGLGGQLYTAWNEDKLEQVTTGSHIGSVGKRVDALMRTSGAIQSMVFAEIKHHKTSLIKGEYRSGAWLPSEELTGAIVQSQQTSQLAVQTLGKFIADKTPEGEKLPTGTYLLKPRCFVIIGSLTELTGENNGVLENKYQSFEIFRRSIQEPEIITFDELLARAEWHVRLSEEHSKPESN